MTGNDLSGLLFPGTLFICGLVALVPFGLWKLVDIACWLVTHCRITYH